MKEIYHLQYGVQRLTIHSDLALRAVFACVVDGSMASLSSSISHEMMLQSSIVNEYLSLNAADMLKEGLAAMDYQRR
jgi:hypothetical protein